MINYFRRLNPVSLIIVAAVAVFLRSGILSNIPETLDFDLFESYTNKVIQLNTDTLFTPSSNVFFALVCVVLQAIIFNRVINNYNLIGKPSFLPALMYVTASSLLMPFLVLSPALLCNFLLIWVIQKFLSIYRKTEARSVMYDCGLLIGLGTLFYFPFISFLPLLWMALIIFRPFDWREWVAGIVGFFTIYFFLGVFYYLNGSVDELYIQKVPLAKTFPQILKINFYDYIVLAPLLLILVLSIISLQKILFRTNMHIRKSYLLLFMLFIFSILSFLIKPEYNLYHFLLAVPPLAVFMAHYFMYATKRWFYEGLYLLLIVFIVYFQFV